MYGAFPLLVFSVVYCFSLFDKDKSKGIWKRNALIICIVCNLLLNSQIMLYHNGIIYSGLAESIQEFSLYFPHDDMVVFDGDSLTARGLQLAMYHYYRIRSVAPSLDTVNDVDLLNLYAEQNRHNQSLMLVIQEPNTIERIRDLFVLSEQSAQIRYKNYSAGKEMEDCFSVTIFTVLAIRNQ